MLPPLAHFTGYTFCEVQLIRYAKCLEISCIFSIDTEREREKEGKRDEYKDRWMKGMDRVWGLFIVELILA